MKNQEKFKGLMVMLCENFNRELTEGLLVVYWNLLKDELTDEQFERAVAHFLKHSKFMPKVADFIDFVSQSDDEMMLEAMDEFNRFIDALADNGVYSSYEFENPITANVIRDMGGVLAFNVDAEKLRWLKKDFVKAYIMRKKLGRYNDSDKLLEGIFGIEKIVAVGSDAVIGSLAIENNNKNDGGKKIENMVKKSIKRV